jgi:hypothetical protein
MAEHSFERWYRWSDRNSISELEHSGVYLIAISKRDIQGQPFAWIPEIVYVGMTNALSGLRGRLKQFDNTILGRRATGVRSVFAISIQITRRFLDDFSSRSRVFRAT